MIKTCKHLQPILDYELQRGNEIVTVTKWGGYDVIYFKKMLDFSVIKGNFLTIDIIHKINRDPHYMTEEIICNYHKKAIMGPLR